MSSVFDTIFYILYNSEIKQPYTIEQSLRYLSKRMFLKQIANVCAYICSFPNSNEHYIHELNQILLKYPIPFGMTRSELDIIFDYEFNSKHNTSIPPLPINYPRAEYHNLNCPLCHNYIFEIEFIDALSYKEFELSGICYKCQMNTFRRP